MVEKKERERERNKERRRGNRRKQREREKKIKKRVHIICRRLSFSIRVKGKSVNDLIFELKIIQKNIKNKLGPWKIWL